MDVCTQLYNNNYYCNEHSCFLDTGTKKVMDAIDLLTDNAKNLTHVVEEVLYATERAIIKLPVSEMERLNLIHQLEVTTDSISSSTPYLGKTMHGSQSILG